MLLLIAAFAAVAQQSPPQQAADADPVVCKRNRTSEVGTHMRAGKVCMKKSEWDFVERKTQRELQTLKDRSAFDPGMAQGARPQ